MKRGYILGILIVLISCSCVQRNLKSTVQTQNKPNQHLDWNSGLRIENGLIQGLSFTDSLGIEYGHAHKTVTIYNDSTVSMRLQMDLSKEYNFPAPHNDQKFKIVALPQELTQNKATFTDSLSDELQNFLHNESDTDDRLNRSIAPHEKYVFTIGRLFEKPTNYYVSPNVLYVLGDESVSMGCKDFINEDQAADGSIALGLRLDSPNLGVGCIIISCGQISFAEH